jgi:hypothetical protein
MSGYSGYSKSNNAINAEYRGLMTGSNAAKWLRAQGKRYKGTTATLIKECVPFAEWHHTSKMYNKTKYYDLVEVFSHRKLISDILKNQQSHLYPRCNVRYLHWEGTKSHPICKEIKLQNCIVLDKGGATVTIITPDDQRLIKNKTTNGFYFEVASSTGEILVQKSNQTIKFSEA